MDRGDKIYKGIDNNIRKVLGYPKTDMVHTAIKVNLKVADYETIPEFDEQAERITKEIANLYSFYNIVDVKVGTTILKSPEDEYPYYSLLTLIVLK